MLCAARSATTTAGCNGAIGRELTLDGDVVDDADDDACTFNDAADADDGSDIDDRLDASAAPLLGNDAIDAADDDNAVDDIIAEDDDDDGDDDGAFNQGKRGAVTPSAHSSGGTGARGDALSESIADRSMPARARQSRVNLRVTACAARCATLSA